MSSNADLGTGVSYHNTFSRRILCSWQDGVVAHHAPNGPCSRFDRANERHGKVGCRGEVLLLPHTNDEKKTKVDGNDKRVHLACGQHCFGGGQGTLWGWYLVRTRCLPKPKVRAVMKVVQKRTAGFGERRCPTLLDGALLSRHRSCDHQQRQLRC